MACHPAGAATRIHTLEDRLTDFRKIVREATEIDPRLRTVAEGYVRPTLWQRIKGLFS
jgi:hypothetical protein